MSFSAAAVLNNHIVTVLRYYFSNNLNLLKANIYILKLYCKRIITLVEVTYR